MPKNPKPYPCRFCEKPSEWKIRHPESDASAGAERCCDEHLGRAVRQEMEDHDTRAVMVWRYWAERL